jgi:hypothetical protein
MPFASAGMVLGLVIAGFLGLMLPAALARAFTILAITLLCLSRWGSGGEHAAEHQQGRQDRRFPTRIHYLAPLAVPSRQLASP